MPIPPCLSHDEVVKFVMGEFKRGKLRDRSGKKVTNRDQAIAIALSQAKRLGASNGKEKTMAAKKRGKKRSKKRSKKTKKTRGVATRAQAIKAAQLTHNMAVGLAMAKEAGAELGKMEAQMAGKKPKKSKKSKKTSKKRSKKSRKKTKKTGGKYNIGKFSKAKSQGATKADATRYARGEISLEQATGGKKRKSPGKKRSKKTAKKRASKKRRKATTAVTAPKKSKKRGGKRKGEVTVTAEKVLTGKTPGAAYHWICSGYKRTGCGGGRGGGHVTGHLGTTVYAGKTMTTFTRGKLRR